jgi:hypothetical protein
LAGLPTIARIYIDLIKQANRFEGREEIAAAAAIGFVIGGSVIGLVYFVT